MVSGGAGRADELDLFSRNTLILSGISDQASSVSIPVGVNKASLPHGENVSFTLS